MLARVLSSFFLGTCAIALLLACNDHDPHPAPLTDPGNSISPGVGGGGSGVSDAGGTPPPGSGDAGVCTDLDEPTTARDEIAVSDPPITGTGGAIVDGEYELTTVQRYVGTSGQPGATGVSYKESMRIAGNGTSLERIRIVQQGAGGVETETNATYALAQVVGGTTLTLTQSCPILGAGQTFTFTASTTNTLTLTSQEQQFTYTLIN